jgi:hypothetical protein
VCVCACVCTYCVFRCSRLEREELVLLLVLCLSFSHLFFHTCSLSLVLSLVLRLSLSPPSPCLCPPSACPPSSRTPSLYLTRICSLSHAHLSFFPLRARRSQPRVYMFHRECSGRQRSTVVARRTCLVRMKKKEAALGADDPCRHPVCCVLILC